MLRNLTHFAKYPKNIPEVIKTRLYLIEQFTWGRKIKYLIKLLRKIIKRFNLYKRMVEKGNFTFIWSTKISKHNYSCLKFLVIIEYQFKQMEVFQG